MTDTSGPRSDEPREPSPSSSSQEDLTRPIPRAPDAASSSAPPVPAGFESGPAVAGSAGAGPAGAGPVGAGHAGPGSAGTGPGAPAQGYSTASFATGGNPPGGPPNQQPVPAHPARRHLLAWVVGGVVVAMLMLGSGFVGGFVVGHLVGSHRADRFAGQRVERFGGPGMMGEQGPGGRFDPRQGDGGPKVWRGPLPGNPNNQVSPKNPNPSDLPTPSSTSSTN